MSTDAPPGTADGPAARRRPSGRWIALAVVVVALLAGGYVLYRLQTHDNWDTVWVEDFGGAAGAAPSSADWLQSTGTSYPGGAPHWGTGEIQTYTSDRANASLDGDGHLKITATRDAPGTWHSARLETHRTDFQAGPGEKLKVEARIQVPHGGAGYWAAFWMLAKDFRGNYVNWPGVGEIDVMEFKGGATSDVNGTFHCGITPGGPCHENNGIGGKYKSPEGALSDGFHTYGVELDRSTPTEEIRWYVDGHRYFTVSASDVDAVTWDKATHHGFFLLLNLAIGGAFPGPPDASTRPGGSMVVDNVTVSRG